MRGRQQPVELRQGARVVVDETDLRPDDAESRIPAQLLELDRETIRVRNVVRVHPGDQRARHALDPSVESAPRRPAAAAC